MIKEVGEAYRYIQSGLLRISNAEWKIYRREARIYICHVHRYPKLVANKILHELEKKKMIKTLTRDIIEVVNFKGCEKYNEEEKKPAIKSEEWY